MRHTTLEELFQGFLAARFKVELNESDQRIMRDAFFGGVALGRGPRAPVDIDQVVEQHFQNYGKTENVGK